MLIDREQDFNGNKRISMFASMEQRRRMQSNVKHEFFDYDFFIPDVTCPRLSSFHTTTLFPVIIRQADKSNNDHQSYLPPFFLVIHLALRQHYSLLWFSLVSELDAYSKILQTTAVFESLLQSILTIPVHSVQVHSVPSKRSTLVSVLKALKVLPTLLHSCVFVFINPLLGNSRTNSLVA